MENKNYNGKIKPLSLKNTPSLIELLLPVQKLSAEAYKEQMAVHGKTLTALGSYWKGRKPLILAKACILGALLPITENPIKDLEIFELLMGMDDLSFALRYPKQIKPKDILAKLSIENINEFFEFYPPNILPKSSPIDWSNPNFKGVNVYWRFDIPLTKKLKIISEYLSLTEFSTKSYREKVQICKRPEEVENIHNHIWERVNSHLGTNANSFPELIEQLGIMRFGHRPKIADTFCGSGQIPFEAARLGCDVYASDLNPVACMLTWGAFNIVGASSNERKKLIEEQENLINKVQQEIDALKVEEDGNGWRAKVFLYCLETRCPQSGWMVPLLPTLVISKSYRTIAKLIPDYKNKRYNIEIVSNVSEAELKAAENGTIKSEGRGQETYLVHYIDGIEYKTKISTIRGDYRKPDGTIGNRLRLWEKSDIVPRPDDIFQERLYCIQWMRRKNNGNGYEYEFRTVTNDDLLREKIVENFVRHNLNDWQEKGYIPDMRIEPGYNTNQPIRERGWTYWHHLFNPRQLLIGGLLNKYTSAKMKFSFTQALNWNSKLCIWSIHDGGGGAVKNTFMNQALNPLFNYGCRGFNYLSEIIKINYKKFTLKSSLIKLVECIPANKFNYNVDIFITDPPYGDAVKYEEILEFFIAWIRKNPPPEFSNWIWDSRRELAIKGEGEDFRNNMIEAYTRMTQLMPDNGLQIIMFTHQSGKIWSEMANIIWASGLQVSAAWYVVTETDSALRKGSYVKGTVLLVCRKRVEKKSTTRDDLAYEILFEVNKQVDTLTGLNQSIKENNKDENLFEDADIQMAGYAAALKVLTKYSEIDGRDMILEAKRFNKENGKSFIDELIDFAVDTANQCLLPTGIENLVWEKLTPVERFYLKMLDLEARGHKTLDNYQNFAKAFKVKDFYSMMGSKKANEARLKTAREFGASEMNPGSELYGTILRSLLYAIMELQNGLDGNEVLTHLSHNISDFYDYNKREIMFEILNFLASKLELINNREVEAQAARILSSLIKNQRIG